MILQAAGSLKIIPTKEVNIDPILLQKEVLAQNRLIENYFDDAFIKDFFSEGSDQLNYYTTTQQFNELYTAYDFFSDLEQEGINRKDLIEFAKLTEETGVVIYVDFRSRENIYTEFALFLTYCLAKTSEGIINSLGFGYYGWLAERSYSKERWLQLFEKHVLRQM